MSLNETKDLNHSPENEFNSDDELSYFNDSFNFSKSRKKRLKICSFTDSSGNKNFFLLNPNPLSTVQKEVKCKINLYKTELCENWMRTKTCRYGSKCHFSHGFSELRPKKRIENYKSRPCVDCANSGVKCAFKTRCNFAHPGEYLRHVCKEPYFDIDYYKGIMKNYHSVNDQLGIYI